MIEMQRPRNTDNFAVVAFFTSEAPNKPIEKGKQLYFKPKDKRHIFVKKILQVIP